MNKRRRNFYQNCFTRFGFWKSKYEVDNFGNKRLFTNDEHILLNVSNVVTLTSPSDA